PSPDLARMMTMNATTAATAIQIAVLLSPFGFSLLPSATYTTPAGPGRRPGALAPFPTDCSLIGIIRADRQEKSLISQIHLIVGCDPLPRGTRPVAAGDNPSRSGPVAEGWPHGGADDRPAAGRARDAAARRVLAGGELPHRRADLPAGQPAAA